MSKLSAIHGVNKILIMYSIPPYDRWNLVSKFLTTSVTNYAEYKNACELIQDKDIFSSFIKFIRQWKCQQQ